MATKSAGNNERMEQIDLTKLNLQQLHQLKMEFEAVSGVTRTWFCVGRLVTNVFIILIGIKRVPRVLANAKNG